MRARTVTAAVTIAAAVVLVPAAAIAAGPNSGGGGGGGTGGGGGGTSAAAIATVGAQLACDGGSGMAVTLQKGFQKRVEVVVTAAPLIQGGRWELHVDDVTHGAPILATATSFSTTASIRITSLGAGVPSGPSQVSIVATRRDSSSTLDTDVPLGPLLETCSASVTVVGR